MIRTRNFLLLAFSLISMLIYLLYMDLLPGSVRQIGNQESSAASVKSRIYSRAEANNFIFPTEDADDPKFKAPPEDFFIENGDADLRHQNYSSLKKILFWNVDDFQTKHYGFGFGHAPFVRAGCRVDACLTTGERGRFRPEELDAVMWHFRSSDKSLPESRSPNTRYVFWVLESASYLYDDISRFDNIFNWTMTYRLDSDFPRPYAQVFRRKDPLHIPSTRNYAEGKTKMAAWFVSHCYTVGGREILVETLQQWIEVDIFGGCGPFKCERSQQSECHKALNDTYKFYLAFENSLCQDYVTEKLFDMLKLDVVPVVYGLGNYSVQAPPHSYIDALSFPTAKDLADYLLYLDRNHTAYNEYFKWKTDYFVADEWIQKAQAYCGLCERLHSDNSTKVYDLSKWYVQESHCVGKTTLEIREFIGGFKYHPAVPFLASLVIVAGVVIYCYSYMQDK